MSLNEKFLYEIVELRRNLAEFRTHLQDHSIWLFLATLGCWSVTSKPLQYAALLLTAFLFVFRAFFGGKHGQSYTRKLRALKDEINKSKLEEDEKKTRLWDVETLEKENLAVKPLIWKDLIYWLCVCFFLMSFIFLVQAA
jgi:cell shape-determining protein MreC